MSSYSFTKPPFHIPDFIFEKKLGEGAAGDVYLARQDRTEGSSLYRAIKVLNLDRLRQELEGNGELIGEQSNRIAYLLDGVRKRFVAEGFAGQKLHHPAFVQYFPSGMTDNNIPHIVMEYVSGLPLDKHVETHVLVDGPFFRAERAESALREVARLGHQLASGLLFAHQELIVHRDIKPENIRVAVDAAGIRRARIKILDLGIAKIHPRLLVGLPVSQQVTRNGVFGTPGFMAPEQWGTAEHVDGRADVYALGQTLLFSLTKSIVDSSQFGGNDEEAASLAIYNGLCNSFKLSTGAVSSSLDGAIREWTKLLIHMIRPLEARASMSHVTIELQRLTRVQGDDDVRSSVGRNFAQAVYVWETTGQRRIDAWTICPPAWQHGTSA